MIWIKKFAELVEEFKNNMLVTNLNEALWLELSHLNRKHAFED